MSKITERLYRAAQTEFLQWCRQHRVRQPANPSCVAEYLEICRESKGPSSVPMQASAIGYLYRTQGWSFDTKAPPIQTVLKTARAQRPIVNAKRRNRQ